MRIARKLASHSRRGPGRWFSGSLSAPRAALSAVTLLTSIQWSVVTGLVTTALGMGMSVAIARSLGPMRMGEYSYWKWLLGALPVAASLGIPATALKFTAELLGRGEERQAAALAAGLTRFAFAMGAAIAALAVLYALLADQARLVTYAIVAGVVLVGAAGPVMDAAIKGAVDYRFSAHVAVLLGLGQLALVLAVLEVDGGVPGLLLVQLMSAVFSLAVTVRRVRHLYPWDWRAAIPADLRRPVFRYCCALTSMSLLDVVVMSRSEVFFLNLFSPRDQVAFYSLAYGIASALVMGATLITHPLLPAFSVLSGRNDWATIERVYRASLKCVALVVFPVGICGIALAEPLVIVLYSAAYAPAAPVLAIVAASSMATGLASVFAALLYGVGAPHHFVRLFVVLAAVDLGASLGLIPRYGAIGAAIANAIGPLVQLIVLGTLLFRKYRLRFPYLAVGKVLVSALGAALAIRGAVALGGMPWLVPGAVAAGLACLSCVVLLRVFDAEDRAILSRLGPRLPEGLRSLYARSLDLATGPGRPGSQRRGDSDGR